MKRGDVIKVEAVDRTWWKGGHRWDGVADVTSTDGERVEVYSRNGHCHAWFIPAASGNLHPVDWRGVALRVVM